MNNYKNSAINLSSFLITGFIGLYIFYFLTKFINITFLGEFNFYYVVVLLLSQLGTFGIHYSILRIASDKSESKDFMNVFSGLLLISVLSFFLFSIIQMLISYFGVEYITINSQKKSLYAKTIIKKGEKFSNKNIIVKGPAGGLLPKYIDVILNRKSISNIEKDQPITWSDF